MQSSSFQGTVPLICPIWPWHLYVVSFHPRGGVARHGGVAQITAICCATVHLSLWIPVTVVIPEPTSSEVSCVFSFSFRISLILRLATSELVSHVRGSCGPWLCTLAFNQPSLRVFACLLGRFHPGVRACLLACVDGCVSCDLWVHPPYKRVQAKLGCILFKEPLGWVQAACTSAANMLIPSEYVKFPVPSIPSFHAQGVKPCWRR